VEKKEEVAKQTDPEVDTANLAEELVQLQNLLGKTLDDARLKGIIDPHIEIEMAANIQQKLSKKLLADLQSYVNKPLQSTGQQGAKDSMVYELFFKPDHTKELQTSKLSVLDKRINELEQLLGPNQGIPTIDLLSTVESLKEKLNLLATPKQLELLQRTVASVSQELDKVLEKKQKQEEDTSAKAHETKVNEIFDTIHRWDGTAQQLPTIVSRLQTLKSLHEHGASFQKAVQQLETQQDELKKLLKFNGEVMNQVDSNFQSNLGIIQNNVQSLEARIVTLSKKMEELGLETF